MAVSSLAHGECLEVEIDSQWRCPRSVFIMAMSPTMVFGQ